MPAVQRSITVRQERFDVLNRLLSGEYSEDSLTRADLFLYGNDTGDRDGPPVG